MDDDPLALTQSFAGSLGLDLSFGALAAGFIFGVIGFYLYRAGRGRGDRRVLWVGVVLMVYPLFVSGAWQTWGYGLALSGLAYYFWTHPDPS